MTSTTRATPPASQTGSTPATGPRRQPLSLWLKEHYRYLWWCCLLGFAWPAADLLWRFAHQQLGVNPLDTLLRTTGRWSLILLLLTLTITPLRRTLSSLCRRIHSRYGKRLSDWNWIIRLRRMLGLYSFYYAVLHAGLYAHFDLGWSWTWAREEVGEKPYLLVGALALAMLIPLAATSTKGMMRRLGPHWRRLHRLTYAVAVLAVLHFWWLSKVGVMDPLPYTALAAFLLGYRLLSHFGLLFQRPRDDGMEVPERHAQGRPAAAPAAQPTPEARADARRRAA